MMLNIALAWIFGLGVLGWLWWASMPARTWEMTLIAGLCLGVALHTAMASGIMMRRRMRSRITGRPSAHLNLGPWQITPINIALVGLLLVVSMARTVSEQDRFVGGLRACIPASYLAGILMIDEAIVERPSGWLPYDVAKKRVSRQLVQTQKHLPLRRSVRRR